jgi:hypothetical protein
MANLYRYIDRLIFVVCLPFYAVFIPFALACEWLMQKRPVRLGQVVIHWPAKDLREEYLVADVSRLNEGLVGVKRRRWGTLGECKSPPFPEAVDFISLRRFWVTRPLFLRPVTVEEIE